MKREDKLIQRMEQGDIRAANELIEMFYPDILRYCLWHAPNRSLAEDAVQETFLKAIRYFDRYTHKGKFKAFLYRIAANTCIDMQRKNRHTDMSLEESGIDPLYAEPAFETIRSDLALKQLVSCLPPELQEIILLRYGQELTLRETAQTLHLPLGTVQSRQRAALKKLKAEIILQEENAASRSSTSQTKKASKPKGGLL